jgi:hypothetical protein
MTTIRMKTASTARKVLGSTAGAGVAAAAATLVIWGIESPQLLGIEMPGQVEGAITTIFAALAAYYAGYYTPPGPEDQIIAEPEGGKISIGSPPPDGSPMVTG